MVPPDTPPGTFVGCIEVIRTIAQAEPHVRPEYRALIGWVRDNPLALSGVYELARIQPNRTAITGFEMYIREAPGIAFPLGCFRVLQLPQCLIGMQTRVPTSENV